MTVIIECRDTVRAMIRACARGASALSVMCLASGLASGFASQAFANAGLQNNMQGQAQTQDAKAQNSKVNIPAAFEALVHKHAAVHGLPPSLVHRVIMRESRYNPRASAHGNYGLMQIRLGTAKAMGYTGNVEGLFDADTNMTYAVKYLAGAYRAAGGNADQAIRYYSRGYYDQAKRMGFSPYQTGNGGKANAKSPANEAVADASDTPTETTAPTAAPAYPASSVTTGREDSIQ
jgi:soluble lytic murein transglycosylase-like protein